MIGQEKLIKQFDDMIENNTLPRFIAIFGKSGSGRKTLAKHIADKLNATLYKPQNNKVTVDYVREIIEQAYKQTDTIVYLLPDVDYFNKSAANALLKITEEPPNNAYFILTCWNGRSIPKTIRSRCVEYRTAPYPVTTLIDFAKSVGIDIKTSNRIFEAYDTPGSILNYAKGEADYKALEEFTEKVIDNIGTVSGANVFKIDERIAFKEDDEGFNLNAFWTVFGNVCMQKAKDMRTSKRNMYFSYVRVTGGYREKLMINGLNKRSLFDLWLLEIRNIYDRYN